MSTFISKPFNFSTACKLILNCSNNGAAGSDIPEEVIQSFPLEKIRQNGPLLQPGVQCRICLRAYQLGQFVRKLPRCKHKVMPSLIMSILLLPSPFDSTHALKDYSSSVNFMFLLLVQV